MVYVASTLHDTTNSHADRGLAVLVRSDRGVQPGKPEALIGRKLGTAIGGTPVQYLHIPLKENIRRSSLAVPNVLAGDRFSSPRSPCPAP
ncbi:MAG: hypothetical protein IT307_00870 [Chloroflexi bacterium]|nr:hypothetical protein [Chloroflexota bacterium]